MIKTLAPGTRTGSVYIPSSKSQAHRALICAALSSQSCELKIDGLSEDILATARCLSALGAETKISDDGLITVQPPVLTGGRHVMRCGESGSTLRFLVPVVGALGLDADFIMEGRLSERPMTALTDELRAHGMSIAQNGNILSCSGRLTGGEYRIPGNISSQFISGLLFALPLLTLDSTLTVTGNTESRDYITMTEGALIRSGIRFNKHENKYIIPGAQAYSYPQATSAERDWSGAAFFLCMGALSERGITLMDMPLDSAQGDKGMLRLLQKFGAGVTIDSSDVTVRRGSLEGISVDMSEMPDLVPTLAALAALCEGKTVISGATRLRYKETDRLKTTREMLSALGALISETEDGLVIIGQKRLRGGCVDAQNDHRIAMAAAVAACGCEQSVTVNGAECVSKSYPDFWKHFETLETEK